ncbi:MAG: hypothetical protein ABI134_18610 [Byssovorax sp.]
MKKVMLLGLGLFLLVGCEDKKPEASTAAPTGAAVAEFATAEDFEEEAQKEITAANASTELDKIEAELK